MSEYKSKKAMDSDVPMGLGMALTRNLDAMEYFSSLTGRQQQQVVEASRQVVSKQEMQSLVDHIKERFPLEEDSVE